MESPMSSFVARHCGVIVLAGIVLAVFVFALWWLSMADASMTGCGGGIALTPAGRCARTVAAAWRRGRG
jgi:hypothetical protein